MQKSRSVCFRFLFRFRHYHQQPLFRSSSVRSRQFYTYSYKGPQIMYDPGDSANGDFGAFCGSSVLFSSFIYDPGINSTFSTRGMGAVSCKSLSECPFPLSSTTSAFKITTQASQDKAPKLDSLVLYQVVHGIDSFSISMRPPLY